MHGENACHNMAVIELIECWVHSLAEVCNVASQCAFWVCGVLFFGGGAVYHYIDENIAPFTLWVN